MVRYEFEWDPRKAKGNLKKHGVSFQRAMSIFRDPHMISVFDEDHGVDEDRWITMGMDEHGIVVVVSHTFKKNDRLLCKIRIISARKAIKNEIAQYKELNP